MNKTMSRLIKIIDYMEAELERLYELRDNFEQCSLNLDFVKDMIESEELSASEKEKYEKELARLNNIYMMLEKEIKDIIEK